MLCAFAHRTKIAECDVIRQTTAGEVRYTRPVPTRMYYRPDAMHVDYELGSPYRAGLYEGSYCPNVAGSNGVNGIMPAGYGSNTLLADFATAQQACIDACTTDASCESVTMEWSTSFGFTCFFRDTIIETSTALAEPRGFCNNADVTCQTNCWVKGRNIPTMTIHEEKFVDVEKASVICKFERGFVGSDAVDD